MKEGDFARPSFVSLGRELFNKGIRSTPSTFIILIFLGCGSCFFPLIMHYYALKIGKFSPDFFKDNRLNRIILLGVNSYLVLL